MLSFLQEDCLHRTIHFYLATNEYVIKLFYCYAQRQGNMGGECLLYHQYYDRLCRSRSAAVD